MASVVIWRPQSLNARLLAAAPPARLEVAGVARRRCSSKRVAGSIGVVGDRVVAAHPLAMIVEEGANPHEIAPRNRKALKLADGSFVSGGVQHPGSPAKPFLKPSLSAWVPAYRRAASRAFRGF